MLTRTHLQEYLLRKIKIKLAEISYKKIFKQDPVPPFVTKEIMVETVGSQMEEEVTGCRYQKPPASPPDQPAGTIFVLPSQQQVNYKNFTKPKTTDMPEVY